MITDLSSPEYLLAEQLIAYLQSDEPLRDHVIPDVYDSDSQVDLITAATGQHDGCIAISPQEIAPAYPEQMQSLLQIRLAVLIFCSPLAAGQSPQRLVSALTARVLQLLARWCPRGNDIPYEEPVIEQTVPLDLTKLEGLTDLIGRGIILRHRIYPISPSTTKP